MTPEKEDAGGAGSPRLAEAVAGTVALAVSNARLRERLRAESIRDPLTRLFNRRYLDESFGREIARAGRTGKPFGIVMVDLDHFKRLNDTEGHAAGDAVLREIGALLAARTRGGDVACRWGGEEFLLLLPDSPPEATLQRAEEIRAALARTTVRFGERLLGPLSASFGVASFPRDGSTREGVVAKADEALYRAKSEGRNRVVPAAGSVTESSGGRTGRP